MTSEQPQRITRLELVVKLIFIGKASSVIKLRNNHEITKVYLISITLFFKFTDIQARKIVKMDCSYFFNSKWVIRSGN